MTRQAKDRWRAPSAVCRAVVFPLTLLMLVLQPSTIGATVQSGAQFLAPEGWTLTASRHVSERRVDQDGWQYEYLLTATVELRNRHAFPNGSVEWTGEATGQVRYVWDDNEEHDYRTHSWGRQEGPVKVRARLTMNPQDGAYALSVAPEGDVPSESHLRHVGNGPTGLDPEDETGPAELSNPLETNGGIGEVDADVSETLPLPATGDVIEGRSTANEEKEWRDALADGSARNEFRLDPGVPEWEVIVTVGNYEHWLPNAGADETVPGPTPLVVDAGLHPRGRPTERPAIKATKFVFTLRSSAEPGICMNCPTKGAGAPEPDLKFQPGQAGMVYPDPRRQSIETTRGEHEEAITAIESFDYGAWGTLHVTAIMPGGHKVEGHLALTGHEGETEILLPKRSKESKIADQWKEDETKVAASVNKQPVAVDVTKLADDDDSDNVPVGDTHQGDGLSLYEEYRGFMELRDGSRVHVRTDPRVKDLFIYNIDLPAADVTRAMSYLAATGLRIHYLEKGDYREDPTTDTSPDTMPNRYVLNFNHGWQHLVDQHAIVMNNDPNMTDYGITYGLTPGSPARCGGVFVNADLNQHDPYFPDDQLANTIAHETAHCLGVKHHGDASRSVPRVYQHQADGSTRLVDPPSRQIKGQLFKQKEWHVAAPGTVYSGVAECLMRYNDADLIEVADPNGARYEWSDRKGGKHYGIDYGEHERPGSTFCKTVFTPPSKVGAPAEHRGNCVAQVCVNDRMDHSTPPGTKAVK